MVLYNDSDRDLLRGMFDPREVQTIEDKAKVEQLLQWYPYTLKRVKEKVSKKVKKEK